MSKLNAGGSKGGKKGGKGGVSLCVTFVADFQLLTMNLEEQRTVRLYENHQDHHATELSASHCLQLQQAGL